MITDEQIRTAAKQIAGKIIPLSELESLNHQQLAYDGAKWMQDETKRQFLEFINSSTGLSQKDKDLIKGVFYGWLSS